MIAFKLTLVVIALNCISATLVSSPYHPIVMRSIAAMAQRFHEIDLATMKKMDVILQLFRKEAVDASSFHGVNGYGYGDIGREKLDNIVASLMGAEKALVRLQFFSGTHAITKALFACLRPGDTLLGVSGKPYDTLEEVIGLRPSSTGTYAGSLRDWRIDYQELPLLKHVNDNVEALFDLNAIQKIVDSNSAIKMLHVQRSCGYQWRPSIRINEIKRLCEFVNENYKSKGRDLLVFCDNCYGELVEEMEPCHVGVDIVAGSLIKNLGGTLAPCGGYVAGKESLIVSTANHLAAPGVEGGATLNQYRALFQGLFLSPTIVGESMKGAELLSHIMGEELGFECNPAPGTGRTDIIQAVKLADRKRLIAFCESVHRNSPVGSYIKPIPGMTAGYGDEVIFADGTFVDGSTLELSADGPLREPFVAYSQGCTHWTHWAIVVHNMLQSKHFSDIAKVE